MRIMTSMAIVTLFLAAGCQDATRTHSNARVKETVPYIAADEFSTTVADGSDLVLVEFCVPSGCFRCDEMRRQIDQLASEKRDGLTVRRVDLNQQPALANQFGVSVCPSYVAFRDGKEVFRTAYPTSADLIVAGLDESLRESSAE